MISQPNSVAICRESAVLPTAVGPTSTTTGVVMRSGSAGAIIRN